MHSLLPVAIALILGIALVIVLQRPRLAKKPERSASGKDQADAPATRKPTRSADGGAVSAGSSPYRDVLYLSVLESNSQLSAHDANGIHHDLSTLTEPAILYVPRASLTRLRDDSGVWSRVKNPDVAMQQQGPSADSFAMEMVSGWLTDMMESIHLHDRELQIVLVDSVRDAQMRLTFSKTMHDRAS